MLRSTNKIIGHRLSAVDGEIGRATDFLLDDKNWVLRYLVVETGPWLSKRRVLISPLGLNKADWTSRRMVLQTTRRQVETAPILEADAHVSQQHELDLSRHYGWDACGFGDYPPDPAAAPLPELPHASDAPYLGSVKELLGYGVESDDGNVGHVEDFIVDDDTWSLKYLVMDSRNWLSGRKILMPTDWIERVNWQDRQLEVPLPSSIIEQGPEYDPAAPVYQRLDEHLIDDSDAHGPPARAPRTFGFTPPETWGTRGLRAALARIIHG